MSVKIRIPKHPVIRYVDAYPGVGKTQLAIHLINESMSREIVMYVAPTHALIQQTILNMKEVCEKEGTQTNRRFIHVKPKSIGEKKVSAESTFKRAVLGSKPGDVILCTHETFIRYSYKYRDKKIVVFFDESVKLIRERTRLNYAATELQRKLLICLIKPYFQEEIKTKDGKIFRRYCVSKERAESLSASKRLSKLLTMYLSELYARGETDVNTSKDSPIRIFLKNLVDPNQDTYIERVGNSEKDLDLKVTYSVLNPLRLFSGFKKVVILSAFFRDSQMYHVMQEEALRQRKKLDIDHLDIPKEYHQRWDISIRKIEQRFKKVHILPILKDNFLLSVQGLELSSLIPYKNIDKIERFMKEKDLSWEDMDKIFSRDYRSRIRSKKRYSLDLLGKSIQKICSNYDGYPTLLQGLLTESQKIVVNLLEKGEVVRGVPTIVLNSREQNRENVQDSFLIKEGKKNRDKKQKLPKEGYSGVRFEPIPANSHGINLFKSRNVMAYLSARNPSYYMQSFLNSMLPDYDVNLDFAAEYAFQSITRLSVRDPDSTDNVFVIVSSLGVAELLKNKLLRSGVSHGVKLDTSYMESIDLVNLMEKSKKMTSIQPQTQTDSRDKTANEPSRIDWPKKVFLLSEEAKSLQIHYYRLSRNRTGNITSKEQALGLIRRHEILVFLTEWMKARIKIGEGGYRAASFLMNWERSLYHSQVSAIKKAHNYLKNPEGKPEIKKSSKRTK